MNVMIISYEIVAWTLLEWICIFGAVTTFWAQFAQNQVLRKQLASAALAARTMSVKNKALQQTETDLLELLSESGKKQDMLLNDSKMLQLANVEMLVSIKNLEREMELYKSKVEYWMEQAAKAVESRLAFDQIMNTRLAIYEARANDGLKSQLVHQNEVTASFRRQLTTTVPVPVPVSTTPTPTKTMSAVVTTRVMGLLGHGVKKMRASTMLVKKHMYKRAPKSPSTPGTPPTTPPPTPTMQTETPPATPGTPTTTPPPSS